MYAVIPVKSTMSMKYLQSHIIHILEYTDKRVHEHLAKESQTPNSSLNPILTQLSNIYLKMNIKTIEKLSIRYIYSLYSFTASTPYIALESVEIIMILRLGLCLIYQAPLLLDMIVQQLLQRYASTLINKYLN